MKLEAGKHYRTLDGRTVGPMRAREIFGVSFWSDVGGAYNADGSHVAKSLHDIIAEWTDTPEVGTLKEIGAKVGDVVALVKWGDAWDEFNDFAREEQYTVGSDRIDSGRGYMMLDNCGDDKHFRIISRASQTQPSPVRTVTTTRQEIIPGVYGKIEVYTQDNRVGIKWHGFTERDELTAAIYTLTTIRDAMQANTTA